MADIRDGTQEVQVPCPICDKPNRPGHKFCRHCGAGMAALASPPPVDAGLECRKCGTANKTEAKFCRACGETLKPITAPQPDRQSELEHQPEPEPETEETAQPGAPLTAGWVVSQLMHKAKFAVSGRLDDNDTTQPGRVQIVDWVVLLLKRKAKITLVGYLIAGAVGLLVIIGGGVALRSAMAESEAKPEMTATAEAAPTDMAPETSVSVPNGPPPSILQGKYSAHLADQDIALMVIGPPSTLAQLGAIITYSNVINGEGCGSALERESGRSNALGPAAELKFRQVPLPGQQACPRAIPVSLDISGQTVSVDGVVQSVQATWLNPDTGEVLMSGQLVRNATQ